MYIEKETYLIKPFIKNSFLKQSVSDFGNNIGNASSKDIVSTIDKNRSVLLSKKNLLKNQKYIYKIFNVVGNSITRDNHIDKAEIYKFIRDYYKYIKKQNITDEAIGNMKVFDMLDLMVIWYKKHQ